MLLTEIINEIYSFDDTERKKFNEVLHQFKICCKYFYMWDRNVSSQLLKNIKDENRARKYFDARRKDGNYTFH